TPSARAQTDPEPAAAASETLNEDACGTVQVAAPTWPAAEIAAALLARLLADGYGCETERRAADLDRALAVMTESAAATEGEDAKEDAKRDAREDGGEDASAAPDADPDADPLPALILTAVPRDRAERADQGDREYRLENGDGPLRLGAALFDARERAGWHVPAWFAAANPQIRTLQDAVAASGRILTRDASARGEKPKLLLCPAHWACAAENRALAAAIGADARFELVEPASGEDLLASLQEANRERRPWIGYLWSPALAAARDPMVRLETGEARICDDQGACRPPFADAPLITVAEARFADRRPRVEAFLGRFAIPLDRMREALALTARTGAGADQAADLIVATDPGLLDAWLDVEARARFDRMAEQRAVGAANDAAPD
ncbi:MAG: glycine betaine ABC transporter substrate-binding protein, partial [Pseudomonadota bacterium]